MLSEAKPGGGGKAGIQARNGGGAQISCSICKTAMNAKSARKMLQEHVDSKHAKATFAQCFPTYTEE